MVVQVTVGDKGRTLYEAGNKLLHTELLHCTKKQIFIGAVRAVAVVHKSECIVEFTDMGKCDVKTFQQK